MPDRKTKPIPPGPASETARMSEVAQRMYATLEAPVVVLTCDADGLLTTLCVAPGDQPAPRSVDPGEHPRIAAALASGEPLVLDVDASSEYGASQALFVPWRDEDGTAGACVIVGVGADAHRTRNLRQVTQAAPERIRAIRETVRLERRIAELAQTASAFRALVESTSDAVKVIDLDGRIRVWNTGCEKLYGYAAREVLGQQIPYLPAQDRSRWLADLRTVVAIGGVTERELVEARKDGSLFTAVVTGVPLFDADGLPVGLLTIVRSVSQDSRLDQMQEDFLSLVSQELKNPLTAILGFAQLLSRPEIRDDTHKRARTVRALTSRAQEMATVIDDLLLASRVDRSGLVLRREATDLAALVTETVAQVERSSPRHRFVVDVDTRLPLADIDARRVSQALANVLANAVKHSAFAEEIRVKVVRDGAFVAMSVIDNGTGIPAEELDRVFDRFYKTKDTKGDPGPGLGLYLVRTIAEAHGGTVSVVSKAKKGSMFTIRLPLGVS